MAVMRYMVVIERGETSWGAHVPDLPGCVAIGETREEVLQLIREAVELHEDRALDELAERRRTSWIAERALSAAEVRARLARR